MKSIRLPSGSTYYAHEHNALRADARAASTLLIHQQLGALTLGTNPTNGQTITLDINGTNVVLTGVTSIGSTAGNFLIGASAAATVLNIWNGLQNPTVTTSTFVALSSANAQLVQFLGWSLPTGGTTMTPFSLNTSTYGPLTSFSASTTVTSGAWTAQTMQLYVESGTYYVGTTRVLYLGGSTATFTAPSSHPRIDLVTADSSGTIALVTGTENAAPVAPSYPANKIVLAEIYNVVSETALYDNDNQQSGQGYVYNDVRPLVQQGGYISSSSQIATGIVVFDPGSDAQGDILYYNGFTFARLGAGATGQVLQTQGASANPQWGYAPGHQILDLSAPSYTLNVNTTPHVISSYSSFPAISANQTIWVRGTVTHGAYQGPSHPFTTYIYLNGTAVLTITDTPSGSGFTGVHSFDVFISVPTPASAQNYNGIVGNVATPAQFVNGTAAANVSSAFTFAIYASNATAATNNDTVTVNYLAVYILG